MSKENPWTYEHWHRWTPRKTVFHKDSKQYEMLERCRGCGELRTTIVKGNAHGSFVEAERKGIPIKRLNQAGDGDKGKVSKSPSSQGNSEPRK